MWLSVLDVAEIRLKVLIGPLEARPSTGLPPGRPVLDVVSAGVTLGAHQNRVTGHRGGTPKFEAGDERRPSVLGVRSHAARCEGGRKTG